MSRRLRSLDAVVALAISAVVHVVAAWLLAQITAPNSEKPAATSPVEIGLVCSTPTLIDREPQILPAGPSAQDTVESPRATIQSPVESLEPVPVAQSGPAIAFAGTPNQGGASGSGGGPAFFPAASQAHSVVFVIDRSMSMGLRGALDTARRQLLGSLDSLPEDVRYQVIAYNRTAELLAPGSDLVYATAEMKRHTATRIESLSAEGGTSHLPALKRALTLSPEVIYFLTDADDLNPEEQRVITKLNRGRCCIHVVELNTSHRDRPWMPLQELARTNRGSYRAVDLAAYRD
jgi:hypothetical protein